MTARVWKALVQMNQLTRGSALELLGFGLIVAGAGIVYWPAALALAGVLLVMWANWPDSEREEST